MKYLKVSLFAFIVTFAISAFAVKAVGNYQAYIGINLPALHSEVMLGPETKTENNVQHYYNGGTVNSCTGNENNVSSAVKRSGVSKSDFITISRYSNAAWPNNNKSNVAAAYNLYVKNPTTTPCSANHSGTWYLDKSAYDLLGNL